MDAISEQQGQDAELLACPDCDLLVRLRHPRRGRQANCPRCDCLLALGRHNAFTRTLAAGVAGLILYLPAVTLPVLQLEMIGQTGYHSLVRGSLSLWQENHHFIALLVLLCSVVAPLLQLLLCTATALMVHSGGFPPIFPQLLKALRWAQQWSMLEVYLLGVLVAYVKMMDPGEVAVDIGIYCLAGLLLCVLICLQSFDWRSAWRQWEERQ